MPASLFVPALIAVTLVVSAAPASGQTPTDSAARTARRQQLDTLRVQATRQPATKGYAALRSRTATRTDTPLRDVPQSVAVLTAPLIRDQAMRGMADAVRYLPGVGMSHGEGNRDAPVLRGNTSTGDLFVDGLRDDVQYFRDLYNVERIEALKGPNAMTFGRGGAGGVLNRVTRLAGWTPVGDVAIQGGASSERRITGDLGDALTSTLAGRVSAVLEQDDSFRSGVNARREGITPSLAWRAGERTLWRVTVEHYRDDRTADRGVPSFAGAPVDLDRYASTFFGDPATSRANVTAHIATVALSHAWENGARVESRLLTADYDKMYRNVYAAGSVAAATLTVPLGAYQNTTSRQNLFLQTDLTFSGSTGPVVHRLLAGVELGQQSTDNVRLTGYFAGNATTSPVPLSAPTTATSLTWKPSATDASNTGIAQVAALYVQDQLQITPWLQAVAGLRVDRFQLDMTNRRTNTLLSSHDVPLSPRAGLIVKPIETVSLYSSWSQSFVPRAGDQLSSLSLTNQALAPEEFRNTELGAKWDVSESLALTAAGYHLTRSNVIVPDPLDATKSILASAQRTNGVELGFSGALRSGWQVAGGYAFQDGRFTQALSATVPSGARLANLPRHTLSLWQRVDVNPTLGVGLGIQRQSAMYAANDNAVALPGFTRVDLAVYARLDATWSVQANLDNLFDARYIVAANTNDNLMPGTPRMLRMVLRATR